jgi:Cu+-exporting ATPase
MTIQLNISGLRCNGCAGKVERLLNAIDGVMAQVSFALEQVSLELATTDLIANVDQVVTDNGYQLESQESSFLVTGWSCAGCANKTVKLLEKIDGVNRVAANAATESLTIEYIKGAVKPAQFALAADSLGYQLAPLVSNDHDPAKALELKHQQQNSRELKLLLVACIFTLPLVIPMIVMLFGISFHLNPWLELALASVVQFVVGMKFYRGAWIALKNRSSNMDTLVVLGTSAAYLYSGYLLLTLGSGAQGALYFEASAVVITFISIGKWLERQAKFNTGQVIRELMALTPVEARVIRNKQEQLLPLEQVLLGDTIRILAGEKIPADGVILSGETEVDESLVTGESLPVVKSVADNVVAGSVNGHGVLTVEVLAVGENSSISQIIKLVESAQMTKAPIERLVDRVSGYFVPVVMAIALLTALVWLWLGAGFEVALINSISVLVVACPCALGLATPAAVVVGSGVAAKHGIIIRDPKALEMAGKLDVVAFDKTGTLTMGTPSIKSVENMVDYDRAIFSSLMQLSEHPLARAIVRHADEQKLTVLEIEHFKVLAGKGVTGRYQQRELVAGNLELMTELKINGLESDVGESIYSQIFFAIDGQLHAIAYLEDAIRTQSAPAIAALQAEGIETAMLSGDHLAAANNIAQQLGINNVKAQLKPQHKLEQLLQWQQQGKRVAMVGDGINDAPALAQADLGIAMGSGTQVAIASADITLIRDNPMLVASAIDIARATWRKIKQNLFLAFIFNSLAIPLAAMGALSPQLAGLAMALSSVTVLANALLLKRWTSREE